MNAQTVGWLVFLALIKNISCEPVSAFKLQDSHLKAKEGSCVEIKCNVVKNVKSDDAYWFWMKNRNWTANDYNGTIIYSTNSSEREVSPNFIDRVKYVGSPSPEWLQRSYKSPKLCSILICNLNKTDSGNYSFRFVGSVKWATKEEAILTVEENPCLVVFEKPYVVKENETVTLTCFTLNSCPSNVQIEDMTKLSSKKLSTSVHTYGQHKSTTVNFTADWKDDGKEFSCQTQDNADKYLIRNVSVTVEYPPKETSLKTDTKSIREGQSVTLTCSAKGRPNPTYTWFKNKEMQSPQAGDNSHMWIMTSIEDSQSGEYHCEAKNKYGETKSNPVIVDVTYPPNVEIKMTSPKSSIRQGDEMTLICNVTRSKPQPNSYSWFKNGTYIGGGQTYDVRMIEPGHSGVYTCDATNTVGAGTSPPFPIKVEYRPWKTRISIPDSPESVKVGHPLTFTCDTEAYPVPLKYSWYRNKCCKKQTDSKWWMSKTTSHNILHLESVQREDEACYICNATNSIDTGDDSQQLCIYVIYPPTKPMLSMDTEVREGQLITINCTVESFPLSILTLTRTSTTSTPSSERHIRKQHDDWSHTNIFSYAFNVTSAHAGFYTCDATNSEGGNRSTQKKLVVKYTPQNVIVKAQPDLVVNEDTLLTLVCSALSHPPVTSVTWMKMTDGKSAIVNRSPSFTLNPVTPSDRGLYSCEASNEIGSRKSQPVEVKVKYAPKRTIITIAKEQQLANGKSAVTMTCSSHCYPTVKQYVWYMKIDGDQEDRKVSDQQIHTVYSDKPGVYYCTAENEINRGVSDQVELFLDGGLTKFFIASFLFILLIIIAVVFIYRYRRNKSIQQGTLNRLPWWSYFLTWRNGDSRRNLMSNPGLVEPSRRRDDLVLAQPRRPMAQPCQPRPDRTAASNITSIYYTVNLPGQQGPSAQKPNRNQGGHTEDGALNYASLHFGNKQKQSKTEQDIHAKVSEPKPSKKNDRETLEAYENMSTVYAAKSVNPLNYDTDTSEDEGEVNYSQVTFNQGLGHRRTNTDTDSSTSDEEYETQYAQVKV